MEETNGAPEENVTGKVRDDKMRAREYIYIYIRARVVKKEASCESACPASRKYGRTKIPHVRREIDEIERVGKVNA